MAREGSKRPERLDVKLVSISEEARSIIADTVADSMKAQMSRVLEEGKRSQGRKAALETQQSQARSDARVWTTYRDVLGPLVRLPPGRRMGGKA